jgi:hypothetical protein
MRNARATRLDPRLGSGRHPWNRCRRRSCWAGLGWAGLEYGLARFEDSDLIADHAVINVIRLHAPHAATAFNTDGGTSLEAARRVLAPRPE